MFKRLYPFLNGSINFKNVCQQPNKTSCGIYAIGFATALALNRKSEDQDFFKDRGSDQSVLLRRHVYRMLTNKELKIFPSIQRTTFNESYNQLP